MSYLMTYYLFDQKEEREKKIKVEYLKCEQKNILKLIN